MGSWPQSMVFHNSTYPLFEGFKQQECRECFLVFVDKISTLHQIVGRLHPTKLSNIPLTNDKLHRHYKILY